MPPRPPAAAAQGQSPKLNPGDVIDLIWALGGLLLRSGGQPEADPGDAEDLGANVGEGGNLEGNPGNEATNAPALCDGSNTRCFPAGTLVATSGGNVPIEAIRFGDEVWRSTW